jgi:hypothetical protein
MTNARRIAARFVASLSAAVVAIVAVAPVQAASLTYVLDRASTIPDDVPYIQVTVADGADGAIDFTVTPLQPLLDLATNKFEIRAFAFNIADGIDATRANVIGLPDHYNARQTTRMDGFGRFDLGIFGTGPAHITSLAFSIVGVDGDTPESYAVPSRDHASDINALFAARVRGLAGETICNPDYKCKPQPIPSPFIGGPGSGNEVPLPATAWLFLTGLAGALVRARRRTPS